MFERRKIKVTVLDLFCLFLGRVVLWCLITVSIGFLLKGIVILFDLFFNVMTNVLHIFLIVLVMLSMIFFLLFDNQFTFMKNKGKPKKSLMKKVPELVLIDLDIEDI